MTAPEMDLLNALNQAQREAVETVEGPLLVIAGAGSGKTRVITSRIAHLIKHAGVRPQQILAVTFTNKAAEEMKSRVQALLGSEPRTASPLISTFHSLCVRILRRDIERLESSYTRDFTIYDTDDQSRLIRGIIKDLGIDDKSITPRQALSTISWAKSRRLSPAAYAQRSGTSEERLDKLVRIYKLFDKRLKQANALDFDDLLIKTAELLRVAELRAHYHERFRHVMIDEFQDTNGIQYELARLIVAAPNETEQWAGRSLCVVGDVDQSIYGFRGADFNIILGFKNEFTGTRIIKLEENYRSTQTILDAANSVISNNQQRVPKTLYAVEESGRGEKIRRYHSYDGIGEAAWVGDKVLEHSRSGTRCAVLYRTNAQSRLFEEALRKRGIKYNLVGGFSFYDRAEVKDIIAYVKLALNPNDDVAFNRVINTPPRGIGKTTMELLYQKQRDMGVSLSETLDAALQQPLLSGRATASATAFQQLIASLSQRAADCMSADRTAAQSDSPSDFTIAALIKAAAFESGYVNELKKENSEEAEGRLLNIEELVNAAAESDRQGESLRDFIDHAALVSDADQYRSDARVVLMTIHSAKGLEFPVVFIVGLEEDLFPHFRSADGLSEIEEERRLCYVAITRAQRRLYLTNAAKRSVFGEETASLPSRFLEEIPVELMEDLSPRVLGGDLLHDDQTYDTPMLGYNSSRGSKSQTPKRTSSYSGKVYNSVDGVIEFLAKRGEAPSPEATAKAVEKAASRRINGDSSNLFKVGSRVKHEQYGFGVVMGSEGSGEDTKVTVRFPGFGIKKFIAKFANLEVIK